MRSSSPIASEPSRDGEAAGPVLLIHDTTELDYTSLSSLTGLGQIGNGNGRGYECHNTLAVHASTRTVLGLANQILARRDTVGKGESRQARRERETRESRLWKRGGEAVGPAPEGACGSTSAIEVLMSLNISHTNTNLRVTLSCGPSTTASARC